MLKFYNRMIQILYKVAYRILIIIWGFVKPTVYGVYVAVWYRGKILIIKNSYKKTYTIPCGRLKRLESPEAAAVRELWEETGIRVDPSQLKLIGEFSFRFKYAKDIGTFFEVMLSEPPIVRIDNREVIWSQFMTREKALSLNLSPTVRLYLLDC